MGSSCRVLSYEITYNVRIRFELLLGIDEIIQVGVLGGGINNFLSNIFDV